MYTFAIGASLTTSLDDASVEETTRLWVVPCDAVGSDKVEDVHKDATKAKKSNF